MRDFLRKHRDILPYAVFGLLTTLVNVVVYWFCAHPLRIPIVASAVIAWVAAVSFAYLMNRRWVFQSEARTASAIAWETLRFFGCRLATGLLDWAIMHVFADRLHLPDVPTKAAANVLVIILNYLASRRIIFQKKR